MKQFKNTFGIRCQNPHLIAAFVQMAKDLGWGDQTREDSPFVPGTHVDMWFHNNNTREDLKPNHFWYCNSISNPTGKPVYTLPAQWDDAVKAMSELKEIKEGDWVVVLPTDEFYGNAEKGIAQQVERIAKENELPYKLRFSSGKINSYKEVRLATEEEIAHAKRLTDKKVTLEKSGRTVTVKGIGVCVAAGSSFGIEEVYKLRKMVGKVSKASTGWAVVIDSVSVGCTSGITMADLDNIINAYESCKA